MAQQRHFVSGAYVDELIRDAHGSIADGDIDKAYAKADQIIGLLDAGMLVSETPQVIVDKARALRDRAMLARMYRDFGFESDDPGALDDELSDLEKAFMGD